MNIVKKYNDTSLIIRILIGMAIGIVLAFAVPKWTAIGILGDLFTGALKAIAPILVLVLIMSSLCNAKEDHKSNMSTVIALYMTTTMAGALVAVCGSFLFPQTVTLQGVKAATDAAPTSLVEVLKNLLLNVVANPVDALVNANYLGILAWVHTARLSGRFCAAQWPDCANSGRLVKKILCRERLFT